VKKGLQDMDMSDNNTMEENNEMHDEKKVIKLLDSLYDKALEGIPKISESVDEIVDDYMSKYDTPEEATKHLIRYQIAKCGTSGFLTGLGGLITLPIAVPANITSVLYVQLRMVAAIAKIGGYDIRSDQVQTLAYACLTGSAMTDILKGTGIKFGEKLAITGIKRIPTAVLVKINQKVGFRFLTKFGEKGLVNIVKVVPVVGGVIGGGIDVGATKIIGSNAYRLFIKGEMPKKNKELVEIDDDDVIVELDSKCADTDKDYSGDYEEKSVSNK